MMEHILKMVKSAKDVKDVPTTSEKMRKKTDIQN